MKTLKSNRSTFPVSMKVLTIGILLFFVGSIQNTNALPVSVSFQVFYDELSPYGDWIEDPNYGFIWVPYVDQSFQPYRTNGHWVMSTYGNTWVSQYDWGWAPFHYGRWFFSDFYGWAWIPGYEWGPAWVNWRSGRGYYGWLPLGPQVYYYSSARYNIYSHWVFVPRRRLLSRRIHRYYMHGRNVNVIYNQTTIINNTYIHNNNRYIAGPSRSELQQVTRRNVPVFEVRQGRRPGRTSVGNNTISVYRPQVSARSSSRNAVSSRPKKYVSAKEYGNTRSTLNSRTNVRSTNRATTRNSNVRSEALRESKTPTSRPAARSAVKPTTDRSNTQSRRVAPSVNPSNSRSNNNIGNTNSRSRNSSTPPSSGVIRRSTTSPNNGNTRRVTPNNQQNRRSTVSPSPRSNTVTPKQSVTKQRSSTQRQVIKSSPVQSRPTPKKVAPSTRKSNSVQRTPPQRTNSRVKSNSSSSSQTRSTSKSSQRSTRSTSPSTRSTRSTRGN